MKYLLNKNGVIALLLLLFTAPASAQNNAPGWHDPNPADYANSMNVTAVVLFNGQASMSVNDTVAYFIGGELRGLADPLDIPGLPERVFHAVTIYSNGEQDAPIEIRVYHAADDRVYRIDQGLTFDNQAIVGDFLAPYYIRLADGAGGVGTGTITLANLPPQTTTAGLAFPALDLRPFVTNQSSGTVSYGLANAGVGITFSIDGNNLVAVADDGFTGAAEVDVTATESANGHSDVKRIRYVVEPGFVGPAFTGIPDQFADRDDVFPPLELADYTLVNESYAQLYSFVPIFSLTPPVTRPVLVNPTNFTTSMTLTAVVGYTAAFRFDHPDDQLSAYVNGELRAVSNPVAFAGNNLFFLNIGTNGDAGETFTLRFYSAAEERIFDWPAESPLMAGTQQGTATEPEIIDLSPILIRLDETTGAVVATRQVPGTSGELTVTFTVVDQEFPANGSDHQEVTFTALGTALPVDLLAFTASSPDGKTVELAWAVARETGLSHYVVERSDDGRSFYPLDRVAAGRSGEHPIYEYRDAALSAIRYYYRLRMEDLDGSVSYSPLVSIAISGGPAAVSLYPNPAPANQRISLKGVPEGAEGMVTIYDLAGRVHYQSNLPAGQSLVLPGLATGTYPYIIRHTGGIFTGRLVVY